MTQTRRIMPTRPPETTPFWEGCRRHELLIPRCRSCGTLYYYRRALCPKCWSPELEWVKASGRGRLYSYVVSHRPPENLRNPSRIIAVVELEEGMRLMCTLKGVPADPRELVIGMSLEVAFVEVDEETTLPTFTPAAS